jgi:thiol:disulfide interchange protein
MAISMMLAQAAAQATVQAAQNAQVAAADPLAAAGGISASFLWLAATAGAISLLTPCVFPMVPITVSYFTQHAGTSRSHSLRNALIFGLGIIATFTALGLALAVFVGATGINQFAANPWVNLFIAAIFFGFAFNLLGAYEIQVPPTLLNKLDAVTRNGASSGTVGALLMGLMFTLTSFTCTAPFVGTILVTASQGEWQRPVAGMLAYSAVFALPFFVLAVVPQWMARLPKSGGWLNNVKVVMGFLEIAAAMKFLSNADLVWKWNIFTYDVVLAVWVAVAVVIAVYLLGKFTLSHDTPIQPGQSLSAGRVVGATAFLGLALWLGTGLLGKPLGTLASFLPPNDAQAATVNAATSNAPKELTWNVNDLPGALTIAKGENKRVFIDYTGYTCTNCRWMEANMFTRPEIKEQLSKFVLAKLYTDGEGEIYEQQQAQQQEQFGTVALPLYAVVDGDGNTIATFPGMTRKPEEFLAFLEKALAN